MSVEVRVPELGESVVSAVIASWLKREGDPVSRGDALVELETDKVNVEVSAEHGGVLQKIVKQEGAEVAVGDVLALIGEDAGQAARPQATASPGTQTQPAGGQAPALQPVTAAPEGYAPVSPLARRVAAEHNVDLSQVRGDGAHGRVTRDDVMSYVERTAQSPQQQAQPAASMVAAPSPQAPAAPVVSAAPSTPPAQPEAKPTMPGETGRREERIRMSRRRQTIALRLVEAQHTAAMLTTFNEIDMGAVMDVRNRRKESFKERHGVSLGFMSFFTKAVVGALKAFPRLNAEIQGSEMILKYYYDIGIAVGAEEGLVVPVLRDADRKSFAEIEREIAELAKRARDNTLALADLQGGTFTITNGGVFGSLLSTPILNGPQVGILGMHKIEQRPVVVNGQVVVRPMMYVAVSYDHRLVDGREAVQFLVRVKELVENPETLLLEG
jgi:2-oxoglutarate dehydrogenase E2 component (dihydrolipoamide succinyltransferase)